MGMWGSGSTVGSWSLVLGVVSSVSGRGLAGAGGVRRTSMGTGWCWCWAGVLGVVSLVVMPFCGGGRGEGLGPVGRVLMAGEREESLGEEGRLTDGDWEAEGKGVRKGVAEGLGRAP